MALIKCENVSIGYEGQMVVHDLNFEINQGDYLCIVGENGSGKSTLVKSLLGLKNVDKGKIVFDDGLKQTEIGYLPQQTDVKKDFPASVYEVVLSGRLNSRGMKPFYTAEDKKQAWEKMDMLGIRDLAKQCFRDLSGGQRQRVALGRAIVRNAKVFLMDEPLSNLDAKLREKTRSEIVSLQRELKTTTIYVTHDQIEAMTMADRIVIMNNGYIMQVGTPTELYDKPDNLFVAGFIGTPNMNFIKCIVDGTSLHIKDEIIPIAVSHQEILKPYDGKEVILGIRPEHIDMSEEIYNLHKAALTLPIDYYEYLGKEYYVKLRLYDDIITARLDSRYDVSKEKITVYFDMDRVCYFDPQTEQRIGRLKEDGKENI